MAPNSIVPSRLLGQAVNVMRAYGGGSVPTAPTAPSLNTPMGATGPSLTPLPDHVTQAVEDHGLAWRADIGQSTATHTFTFRNDNKAPVEIRRVQPSCGCSAVSLVQRGQPVGNPIVAPGDTLQVCVPADIGEGPIEKTVSEWLYGEAEAPVAWVRMTLSRR